MGQMRFHAAKPEKLLCNAVDLAYVAGMEAIPWRSINRLDDHLLTIERSIDESGNLYIPWQIPGIGQRMLSTCTLMEREQPYCLVTELARGTLHRARALAAGMEAVGRAIPDATRQLLADALTAFISATTRSPDASDDTARSITLAAQAIDALTDLDMAATLEENFATDVDISTMLIGPLGNDVPSGSVGELYRATFHAAALPLRWRELQPDASTQRWGPIERQWSWCHQHGLRTIGGPLIQLDRLSLPDWVFAHQGNYDQFEAAAVHHVQSVVQRFRGRIDIWVSSGRLNVPGAIAFTEEQKLRLAVATLEAARSAAPQSPVLISFDQPWAEYLAAEDFDLSPLHFADALVRADLGVAGVALEMNLGYWPSGTLPRDLLAISRHIDLWSLLGIPLIAYLSLPSATGLDPHALGRARVVPRAPDNDGLPAMSQDVAVRLVPLLLTKPSLHGIVWSQFTDAENHEFPHSGLLDAQGQPKPIFRELADIREKYLS